MKKLLLGLLFVLSIAGAALGQNPTGSITATNAACTSTSCVQYIFPMNSNYIAVAVQVTGTYVGTLAFESSTDLTNYIAITGTAIGSGTSGTSTTTTGVWQFATAGLNGLRVRASAYTSGTAAISFQQANGPGAQSIAIAGSTAVTLASGAVASGAYSSGSIASGAVASGAIASGAVASGAYASGSIGSGAIASGAIASGAIASGAAAAGAFSAQSYAVGAIPPAAGTLTSGAVTSAMTGTTSTSVIGATASNYIYITQCTTSNASLTVSTDILLQDGSGGTTLYVLPIPAATVATTGGAGSAVSFPVPLKVPTAGNALFAANVTTGSSTKISCSGFKSTVSY